jgi:putative oxygen-independent coproporphyrinogen III oxidase
LPENRYIQALLDDLAEDMQFYAPIQPLQSIFIGGGTPSLLTPEAYRILLEGIGQQIEFLPDIEITLEANPGTFESKKFAEFRALGINRLSIGIQSFQDVHLTKLGRIHSGREAIYAAEMARKAGFDNINLDLMFGLPSASLADAQNDIATAVALEPTHISFYQLTLEPNTYFYKFPPQLPNDEFVFAIQTAGHRQLAEHQYRRYEISAFSKPSYQCRHNTNYWQFGDYLGIGAGAHGKVSKGLPDRIYRSAKLKNPETYLNAKKKYGERACIASDQLPLEFLMNQLRLDQGFEITHYVDRTGLAQSSLQPGLAKNVANGLLQQNGDRIFCSERGRLFLDSILQDFLSSF